MRYAMIMAGGAGTRLWPMSRRARPKQLLPFIGGKSLLQIASERINILVPSGRQYICTGEAFRKAIRASLPQFTNEQILGEPVGRDTVNAVALTAAVLAKRDDSAVFVVLTADHLITPEGRFRKTIETGIRLVEDDPNRLVTFSIEPTYPATGYGYVQRGSAIPRFKDAFVVKRFIEKPAEAAAKRYLRSGRFGWNSGMFVFSAAGFLRALERFEPNSHTGVMSIAQAWSGRQRSKVLQRIYPSLPKKSVDFAIMEPASTSMDFEVCTVRMQVNWLDVGSWPSFGDTLKPDRSGNRSMACTVHAGSTNVLAVSDDPKHLIATVGCEDMIVIHTRDATLVCPVSKAQLVKDLVDQVPDDAK